MRELFASEIAYFKSLTLRERAIVIYVALSFCTLSVTDDSDFLIIVLIMINFINAGRLLRTVPMPPDDDDAKFED